jgi:hypoxanthine phosphoribosyltransferase
MHELIERVLISEEQIKTRIAQIAKELETEYKDKNPLFVGLLKGVVVFFSDMFRAVQIPCELDFMVVSSYHGTESTGVINVKKDLDADIQGRHVVILEDIIDSGRTLSYTVEYLKSRKPASLKICTLLDKPDRRETDLTADYVGFTIPNEFVVGYGLDFNERFRNLPYVGVLKPETYS